MDEEENTLANGFEDADDTRMDVFEEGHGMEKDELDLDATDENCCTYTKSLDRPAKRRRLTLPEPQTLYLCLTCCPEIRKILEQCAQICTACSYHCHENHELLEWYTKRNLLCDCPTERIPKGKCAFNAKILNNGKKSPKKPTILNSTRKRRHSDTDAEQDRLSEFIQDISMIGQTTSKQYTSSFPHHLIGFMYRFDLSVLCLVRKLKYEDTYPSLSVKFQNNQIDKFNNIILHHKDKSIYIQIEHVDTYKNTGISYAGLFSRERGGFSIHEYFDSFVRYILTPNSSVENIESFVIYTNSSLDLTDDNKIKARRLKNVYPFLFTKIEGIDMLKKFFFDGDKGGDFYEFSRDKATRDALLQRLELSSVLLKDLEDRNLSHDKLKNQFLDRLVYAVNQPSREELNSIIKCEIEMYGKGQVDYSSLKKNVLRDIEDDYSEVLYKFNLLKVLSNQMFLHRQIVSISSDMSADLTIHHPDNKVIYIQILSPPTKISYSILFATQKEKNSLNDLFSTFIEKSKENLEFFILYSDASINLSKEMTLQGSQTKDFQSVELVNIDCNKKEYEILRNPSYINEKEIYKFSEEKSVRKIVLKFLKLPLSLRKERKSGKLSTKSINVLKEKFLDKLIFACDQPKIKKFKKLLKKESNANIVPYNYEELSELALRWSESHELGPLSLEIMETLLDDIKNNRLSYQRDEKYISEEIKFARSVVGKERSRAYNELLDLLVKEKRINFLKSKGINPANVSSVVSGAGDDGIQAVNELCELWFDKEGNKSQYLRNLEDKGVNLINVTSILNGSRGEGAKNFKSLYNLWFDKEGNKTRYLTRLEEEGLNVSNMSSIFNGTRSNHTKSFKDLYDFWFDKVGNKTQYLKSFEKEGIDLTAVCALLCGSKENAANAFKQLYDAWFDESGNKTQYLKVLEKEGIDLCIVSSILNAARGNAAKAFNDLYKLWFDEEGSKTQYSRTLAKNGIRLIYIANILSGAGSTAAKTFKDLYDLWFDKETNKTIYLRTLEENATDLNTITFILYGAGSSAAKVFKELYDLWFDKEGDKTQYLKTLEERGITLKIIATTLNRAGANAARSFKELYNTFIDAKGNEIKYYKTLEENGINLTNVCGILSGAGLKASKTFQDLYNLWFDEEENKTHYLKMFEEQGLNLSNMSSILSGAGQKAPQAFKDLYNIFFDSKGDKTELLQILEENKIDLNNILNILHGSGADISKSFKELYSTFVNEQGHRKPYLEHFVEKKDGEKGFKLHNLSTILNKTGIHVRDAFERLHSVCFDDEGTRTQLINDFYKAGFKPSNLATLLNGTGTRAAFSLKRFHSICFSENGAKRKVLDDFSKAGFTMGNLCSLLSGTPNTIEILHNFCFVRETKKYLERFLNETNGFTAGYLSKILDASGPGICFVLKDFHDVCYNKAGHRKQVLDDFYDAGFRSRDLANILSMAGSKAAFLLLRFHNLCFGHDLNYLNYFLTESELFTPKNLSKILCEAGINVCSRFEKLYSLCFDREGNRKKYLKKLLKKNTPNEVLDILRERAIKASNSFLDDIPFQELKIKKELLENR